ncbi:MAG: hypothetical protein IK001_06415 [Lachnospiraceae bacterium]|nr:hypothetical protein [Lachnospiraceae bacterium]
MKFCAYCGRQLQDDEVCTCRDAQKPADEVKTAGENIQENVTEAAAAATETAQNAAPAYDYAPYQSTAPAPKAPKKWLIPVLCAAGVVALAAIVFAAVSLFGGSKSKVGKALAKTFEDTGYLAKDLGAFNYDSGKYSLGISGKYQKIELGMGVSVNDSEMQMNVSVKEGKDVDLGAVIEIGKKAVKAKLTGTDYKKVLVYDYTNDNKDGLEELAGEDTIKSIDEALEAFADGLSKGKSSSKKYEKEIKKWFDDLKIKKDDTKSIKVNGEKRDCKGYSMEITSDDLEELVDIIMDMVEKDAADVLEKAGTDIDDLKKEITKEIDKMDEDIELTFYLYKDMIAGIVVEYGDDAAYAEFNGGDYRLQNFAVYNGKKKDDSKLLMKGTGKTSGDKESMTIEIPEEFSFSYSYDKKSGKFEVSAQQYSYWYGGMSDVFSVKGTLECSKSTVTLTVKELNVSGTTIPVDKLEITFSSKDNMETMKGTEFSVDKADEDDLKDELMELYEAVSDALDESETLKDLISSLKYMF